MAFIPLDIFLVKVGIILQRWKDMTKWMPDSCSKAPKTPKNHF